MKTLAKASLSILLIGTIALSAAALAIAGQFLPAVVLFGSACTVASLLSSK